MTAELKPCPFCDGEADRITLSDYAYQASELATAAACYALNAAKRDRKGMEWVPINWPLPAALWKPTTPRRDLLKAAALILEEIERMDRIALAKHGSKT